MEIKRKAEQIKYQHDILNFKTVKINKTFLKQFLWSKLTDAEEKKIISSDKKAPGKRKYQTNILLNSIIIIYKSKLSTRYSNTKMIIYQNEMK